MNDLNKCEDCYWSYIYSISDDGTHLHYACSAFGDRDCDVIRSVEVDKECPGFFKRNIQSECDLA